MIPLRKPYDDSFASNPKCYRCVHGGFPYVFIAFELDPPLCRMVSQVNRMSTDG